MSTLALVVVAPAGRPWCGSINLSIVLVDQYRPDGATALVRRAATTTKCGGWATATTALGGRPDGTVISQRSRDGATSKQQQPGWRSKNRGSCGDTTASRGGGRRREQRRRSLGVDNWAGASGRSQQGNKRAAAQRLHWGHDSAHGLLGAVNK